MHHPLMIDSKKASASRRPRKPRLSGRGFTLVEILIVVVILGILAAIVVPQFTSASRESRENSLKMTLHRMRTQIEVYREQHDAPPELENFAEQLTLSSNTWGETAAVGTHGYSWGPYIRDMPVNPMNQAKDVGEGDAGTSAWYYNEETGEFRANDSEATREY